MPIMKLSLPHMQKKTQPSDTLQVLLSKLAQNNLTEFKLGFDGGEIRSKRDVQNLIKVIQDEYLHKLAMDKYSSLVSIRIGWKLPRFALAPILQQVLPLLLQHSAKVKHLQLVLDAWIPESALKKMVSWHTLETIDIRGTRIRTRCQSDPRHDRGRNKIQIHDMESSMIEDCIVRIVPFISDSVHTLRLVDCDLQNRHMAQLARYLKKKRTIQSLSLRHNRDLDICGGFYDLSLPSLRALDLSICDLDPADGWALAKILTVNHRSLNHLSVAGNYRMSIAIPKLVEAVSSRLIELDCSFCDVNSKLQMQVFETLAHPECTLQSLRMRATRLNDVDMLVHCLRHNTSLERLIIDHPADRFPVDSVALQKVSDALQHNYHLQDLRVDSWVKDGMAVQKMQFWLELNRCGRRIVLQDNNKPIAFLTVLQRAARTKDSDIVFWLLKNGAEQF